MNRQRRELGILADGTKIETENLRDLGHIRQARYAREITKLGYQMMQDGELGTGQTPIGLARTKYVYEYMSKLARKGSALCNLVFMNDELLGATYMESRHASGAPMIIARPGESNDKVEYQLASPYRNDAEANLVVASTLIKPKWSGWQWDFANSTHEQVKTETYSQLGMVVVADGSEWIYTVDRSGTKGAELWAKPPTTDNPILATAMQNLNDEVLRLKKGEKDPWEDS